MKIVRLYRVKVYKYLGYLEAIILILVLGRGQPIILGHAVRLRSLTA